MTKYSEFVKQWAKDNNLTYGCAISNPQLKTDYANFKKTGEFDIIPKKRAKNKEFSIVPVARARPKVASKSKEDILNMIRVKMQKLKEKPRGSWSANNKKKYDKLDEELFNIHMAGKKYRDA